MSLSVSTDQITEAERLELDRRFSTDSGLGNGPAAPLLVAIAGLGAIVGAFVLIRQSTPIGAFLALGGCASFVLGGWVAHRRWFFRRFEQQRARTIRELIDGGSVRVSMIAADQVVPVPGIDDDCDGALFRVDADTYALVKEDVLSWLDRWIDGRYPASLTIRSLPDGTVISVQAGTNDATVEAPLADERADRVVEYLLSAGTWEQPCAAVPAGLLIEDPL